MDDLDSLLEDLSLAAGSSGLESYDKLDFSRSAQQQKPHLHSPSESNEDQYEPVEGSAVSMKFRESADSYADEPIYEMQNISSGPLPPEPGTISDQLPLPPAVQPPSSELSDDRFSASDFPSPPPPEFSTGSQHQPHDTRSVDTQQPHVDFGPASQLSDLDRLMLDLKAAKTSAQQSINSGLDQSSSSHYPPQEHSDGTYEEVNIDSSNDPQQIPPNAQSQIVYTSSATHELDNLMLSLHDMKKQKLPTEVVPSANTHSSSQDVSTGRPPVTSSSTSNPSGSAGGDEINDGPVYATVNKTTRPRINNDQQSYNNSSNVTNNNIIIHPPSTGPPADRSPHSSSKGGSGVGPSGHGPLENMLGTLKVDMMNRGAKVVEKGNCYTCNKPIVGKVITAMGNIYHPEHFTCGDCGKELGTLSFFERDGSAYCEPDYHKLFSPKCAYCNGPIVHKVITVKNRAWHPEHFVCMRCNNEFGPDGFREKDDQLFCGNCYMELFAPKCATCLRPILDGYISAMDKSWHTHCFVCAECQEPFEGASFYEYNDGLPYCERHYLIKQGSVCGDCGNAITGPCITAMGQKFHPEHFVCKFCLKQLNKGTFKEQDGKPYCHVCFVKLFAKP